MAAESASGKITALFGTGEQNPGKSGDSIELAAVFAGANVGLALFDQDLKLLACNVLYRALCGYQVSETSPGAALTDLMRISLRRQNAPEETIARTIEMALNRLEPGSAYTFRYTSPSARAIEVMRRRLPSGAIVETVRETATAISGTDLNTQVAHIAEAARVRMMHALDVMADGFALFDAQDKLVVYNRRYIDTKQHVADLILPGAAFETLLMESVRRGGYMLNSMSHDDYIAQRMRQHANPGEPYEVQLADGRWILVNEQRTADGGTVGIRSDITEMKHREFDLLRISQQLHAKHQQFDTALNNMIQGLCMFDKDQRLIVCNRRYLDLYGFSAEVVKPGILLREIMMYSISLGNYTEAEAARAISERPDPNRLKVRTTIKQRLKDGRVIAVMNEPMTEGGSIATYQDVTEAERHNQQVHEYTQKLERSNQELENFAYVASHDLQEPLRKIEAFGDRLLKRYGNTLPDEGKMFLDRMQNAAQRMRRLISDLLSFSRVASKSNPASRIELDKIMVDVLSDLQVRIDETKATINVGPLGQLEADPTQMRQLFQNLLANAIKFTKKDVAPIIEVSATRIEVMPGTEPPVPAMVLTLVDNGIGFDNQYKHQIFKIFQRLHGRLEYEGTGIGLATCRKIVERHHGTIDADGRPGVGSTFTIVLPLVQPKPVVLLTSGTAAAA